MGTPGVPLDINKDDLINSIKKHKGRVKHIAAEFNCHRGSLLPIIREIPEAFELLNLLRNGYDDLVLGMAEDNIVTLLEDCDSTATFFTLNTRGEKRGWVPKGAGNSQSAEQAIAQLKLTLSEQQELAELRSKQRADHSVLPSVPVPDPAIDCKSQSDDLTQS